MRRRLIVYAKRPLPGYAKTRLGADLGDEAAAGVYARILYAYLVDLLNGGWYGAEIELAVGSEADVPFFKRAFPELTVRPQVAGDLGVRLADSFDRAFDAGAERVVLTGSDIPDLNAALVRWAFAALEEAPVTLGPAVDGGYYLIGMQAPGVDLFDGIEWSTERVLAQTEARARAAGLEVFHLPELLDIDTVDDFREWAAR